jgi:uncharacterized membrane protein
MLIVIDAVLVLISNYVSLEIKKNKRTNNKNKTNTNNNEKTTKTKKRKEKKTIPYQILFQYGKAFMLFDLNMNFNPKLNIFRTNVSSYYSIMNANGDDSFSKINIW